MSSRRPLWSTPWGFAEGVFIPLGLLVTGLTLQIVSGHGPALPVFPFSAVAFAVLVAVWLGAWGLLRTRPLLDSLAGLPASLGAMVGFFAMVLVLGFVPQGAGGMGWTATLGLDRWLTSWPFLLSALWLATVLALSLFHRMARAAAGQAVLYGLSHGGFLVVVLAMFFGAGDLERYRVTLARGETVWQGLPAGDGKSAVGVELPIAFSLEAFTLEEYAPRMALVPSDGKAVAKWQSPGITNGLTARLGPYVVTVLEVLTKAAPVGDRWLAMEDAGTSPACRVRLSRVDGGPVHPPTGSNGPLKESTGWLATGSFKFQPEVMPLPGGFFLALATPEPKRFATDFSWWTKAGGRGRSTTELNLPAAIEGWKIYQVDFDQKMGRRSETSVLEIVRDPWLPVVHLGMFLLLFGALGLLFTAPGRRGNP